jgi:hypothetical protein
MAIETNGVAPPIGATTPDTQGGSLTDRPALVCVVKVFLDSRSLLLAALLLFGEYAGTAFAAAGMVAQAIRLRWGKGVGSGQEP